MMHNPMLSSPEDARSYADAMRALADLPLHEILEAFFVEFAVRERRYQRGD